MRLFSLFLTTWFFCISVFGQFPDEKTKTTTAFTSSNLPIFKINTNGQEILDDPKITAELGIIYNGPGYRNNLTDAPLHYNGSIGIELRGNSTQWFPKKPYAFETRDSQGDNLNVSLLGMPEENDWILRASYLDHTFIRNQLAGHMSRLMRRWASRTYPVEVVINGEYLGIYILLEKIKVDVNRVNIARLAPEHNSLPEISGGYIYEITGLETNLSQSRNLKYPDFDEATPGQKLYIENFDNSFRNVMNSVYYTDEVSGYYAWIDVPSFVDELLVQEAMRNSDAYGWSAYFHKDRNGLIKAGPVWDFDQSAGNSSYPDNGVIEGWLFEHPWTNNTPFFWSLLFEDPAFSYRVKQRWESLREDEFSTANLLTYVDSLANFLSEAQVREFEKWPVLGQDIWRETEGYEQRDTYQKEVDYLKDFLTQRWNWMDTELAPIKPPNPVSVLSKTYVKDIMVYPNPATNFLLFDIHANACEKASIYIYDQLGNRIQPPKFISLNNESQTFLCSLHINHSGIYFYQIIIKDTVVASGKFIVVK